MSPKIKGKPSKQNGREVQTKVPNALPSWPLLQPLISPEDLAFEEMLEGQVHVVRNLFTSTLCKKHVSFLSSLSLQTTPAEPKEGEALR